MLKRKKTEKTRRKKKKLLKRRLTRPHREGEKKGERQPLREDKHSKLCLCSTSEQDLWKTKRKGKRPHAFRLWCIYTGPISRRGVQGVGDEEAQCREQSPPASPSERREGKGKYVEKHRHTGLWERRSGRRRKSQSISLSLTSEIQKAKKENRAPERLDSTSLGGTVRTSRLPERPCTSRA